jgi:predicted TIM-barrel fold metal-dependent hydrolase
VIDLHVHSTNTSPQEQLERMKALNIRFVWVAALAADLQTWRTAVPSDRFLPALSLPCVQGRAPFVQRACWEGTSDFPDAAWLRDELRAGRIKGLGELVPQLIGISPNDARLEAYWALAEEFDIPVAIHMGPAPPGAAYESSPSPFKFPEYRVAANNPLLLEEVLLRHKRLRILLMHAGWPFLDATLALLYAHPNVFVDVGALQAEFMVPRASYYRHLRGLVEGGFSKRIVFGSDFPTGVATGIDAILAADFLTDDQKADILCRNASRFLKLGESVCAP